MNFRMFSYLFFYLILLAYGCTQNKNPLTANDTLDPRILGTWVKIDTSSIQGSPKYRISGINIGNEGSISLLGIETSTGKLARYHPMEISRAKVIHAYNGDLKLEVYGVGLKLGGVFEGNYSFLNGEIEFIGRDNTYLPLINGKYKKSKIGEKITEPIISDFFVIVDQDTFINSKIWSYPSAYASFFESNDSSFLKIIAIICSDQTIIVEINNFKEVGKYIIGTTDDAIASYHVMSGDVIYIIYTRESQMGILEIIEFDYINNKCSGTFQFKIDETNFSDGQFKIPIYKYN